MLFGYWACNMTLLPRHNHAFQPRLRTIAARGTLVGSEGGKHFFEVHDSPHWRS
jgi:hypothetical protein